jgi:hypothetical protein
MSSVHLDCVSDYRTAEMRGWDDLSLIILHQIPSAEGSTFG